MCFFVLCTSVLNGTSVSFWFHFNFGELDRSVIVVINSCVHFAMCRLCKYNWLLSIAQVSFAAVL